MALRFTLDNIRKTWFDSEFCFESLYLIFVHVMAATFFG